MPDTLAEMLKLWREIRAGFLLIATTLVAGLLFWWIARLVGFPRFPGYNTSLLLQPLAVAKLLAVTVGIILLTALATLACGRIRYDAGWGCVALGLYALRLLGGPIYSTIDDRPPGVFAVLALELLLLTLVLGVMWGLIHLLRERGTSARSLRRVFELPEAPTRIADRKATAETIDQKILALVMSAGTFGFFMMILCQSQERAQVFFAIAISSYLAVWITHAFIPTRPGFWFWGGPILAGVAGYVAAWLGTSPAQLAVGEPGGWLAPLARPLPLDYVSLAVPVALWRYVTSRTHQTQQVIESRRQEAMKTSNAPAAA